jgi:hypothetical protein
MNAIHCNTPAGSILNVTGTSTPANATYHCAVSVIINGIRPYQKAIPKGSGNGTEDYTSWKFADNHSYTTIKAGQNKITAKYSFSPLRTISIQRIQDLRNPDVFV